MTTHVGKIARLSKRRRDEIGRRMENGQSGRVILKWLNQLKDVKAVLRAQFGGRAINEPNFTAWRQSGYVEWLALERQQRPVRRLAEEAEALAKTVGSRSLGNGLAIALAVELDGAVKTLVQQEPDPEKRWERVCRIHREVSRLRRDDDRVKRTSLKEAQVQCLKSKVQSLKAEGGDEDEAYWNQEEPSPQGIEAAREAAAAMGGWEESKGQSLKSKVSEDEDEHEDENDSAVQGVNEDKLRQIKAGQGGNDVQNPRSKVQSSGGTVQFLHEERLPYPDEPGCEILYTSDNTYGTRYRKVPIGWQDPEGISPGEVQGPKSQAQSPAEARPAVPVNSQTGAEARPANPVNWQAARSALGLPSGVPYVPDPDPEVEAYNRWWRMNRGFDPFDAKELDRIYAELPQKIAEYQAKMLGEGAEYAEGAGI
jgi:hypothetical protein